MEIKKRIIFYFTKTHFASNLRDMQQPFDERGEGDLPTGLGDIRFQKVAPSLRATTVLLPSI